MSSRETIAEHFLNHLSSWTQIIRMLTRILDSNVLHVENPKLQMQVNQGVLGIGTVQPAELRNSQSMSSRPFITPLLRAVNECVSVEDI